MEFVLDDSTPQEVLREYAKIHLYQANKIIQTIDELEATHAHIENLKKFRKRVVSERDFLASLVSGEVAINKSHVSCSNLPHFQAILDALTLEKDIVAVQKVFLFKPDKTEKPTRFEVDIVSRGGACWIKVKAMKAEAIQSIFNGNATFGTKSITFMGKQLVECATQHYHHYKPPQCVVWFTKGVTEDVADELSDMGIVIRGEIQDKSDSGGDQKAEPVDVDPLEPIKIVNLDVTTLITLVSHVTNGGAHFNFENEVLQYQAEEERRVESLPRLKEFMKEKKIIVTNTAREKFLAIVDIVGGESEKRRTEELMASVTLVDDCPSEKASKLKEGPKIKQQHIAIFGTGDYYKATTLTANSTFTRAAAEQGIEFSVFMHPARALTEQKALPPITTLTTPTLTTPSSTLSTLPPTPMPEKF